jgi:hypothetical protein
VGFLEFDKEKQTVKSNAITWSVVSRLTQSSPLSSVLSSDSSAVRGVKRKSLLRKLLSIIGNILWLSQVAFAVAVLINIAGIVTPLGLSDTETLAGIASVPFAYSPDNYSAFGYPVTSRRDLFQWTRGCGLGGFRNYETQLNINFSCRTLSRTNLYLRLHP